MSKSRLIAIVAIPVLVLYPTVTHEARSPSDGVVPGAVRWDATYQHILINGTSDQTLYVEELGIDFGRMEDTDFQMGKLSLSADHSVNIFHNRLSYGGEVISNHYYQSMGDQKNVNEQRFGLFVQDEINLSEMIESLSQPDMTRFFLTAGLRFDHNATTGAELSPRASLVVMPGANHSFRILYEVVSTFLSVSQPSANIIDPTRDHLFPIYT